MERFFFILCLFINNILIFTLLSIYLKKLEIKNQLLDEKIDFLIHETNTKVLEIKTLEDKIDTLLSSNSLIEKKFNFIPMEYLNLVFDRIQPITPYIPYMICLFVGYWSFYHLADAVSKIDNDAAILLHQQYTLLIEQPLNYVSDTIYFNTMYHVDMFILRVFFGDEPIVLNPVPDLYPRELYPHLYPPETEAASNNTLTNITELVISNLYACTESILNFLYSLW
jgi:hypothetical protein